MRIPYAVTIILVSTFGGCVDEGQPAVWIPFPREDTLYSYTGSDGSFLEVGFTSFTATGIPLQAQFTFRPADAEAGPFRFTDFYDSEGRLQEQVAHCGALFRTDDGTGWSSPRCINDWHSRVLSVEGLPGGMFSSSLWGRHLRASDEVADPLSNFLLGVDSITLRLGALEPGEEGGLCARVSDDFGLYEQKLTRLLFFSYGIERIYCSGHPVPYLFTTGPLDWQFAGAPITFALDDATPFAPVDPNKRHVHDWDLSHLRYVDHSCPYYLDDPTEGGGFTSAEAHQAALAHDEEYKELFGDGCRAIVTYSGYVSGTASGPSSGFSEERHLRELTALSPDGSGLKIRVEKRTVNASGIASDLYSVDRKEAVVPGPDRFHHEPAERQIGIATGEDIVRQTTNWTGESRYSRFSVELVGYGWTVDLDAYRPTGYDLNYRWLDQTDAAKDVRYLAVTTIDGVTGRPILLQEPASVRR